MNVREEFSVAALTGCAGRPNDIIKPMITMITRRFLSKKRTSFFGNYHQSS
ncbi:MAG: hypothetical protein PVH64_02305 [Bacillota bacterium]